MSQVQPSRQHHVDRRRLLLTARVYEPVEASSVEAVDTAYAARGRRVRGPRSSANVHRRFGKGEEGGEGEEGGDSC